MEDFHCRGMHAKRVLSYIWQVGGSVFYSIVITASVLGSYHTTSTLFKLVDKHLFFKGLHSRVQRLRYRRRRSVFTSLNYLVPDRQIFHNDHFKAGALASSRPDLLTSLTISGHNLNLPQIHNRNNDSV